MRLVSAALVPMVGALIALNAPVAVAKTNACRATEGGFDLRASMVGCTTARSVERTYYNRDLAAGGIVVAGGRTWRCHVRILKNHGYDPAIFGDRVTGRVLCTHVANRGRFVRWKYLGGGD